MMISYYLPLAIVFLLALYKLLIQPKYHNHAPPSQLPPSPPSLPLIGHLHLLLNKRPLHRTLADIAAAHGPVLLLRFGSRPVLLVSSPAAAEQCFTANDAVFADRPRLLSGKHLEYNYTSLPVASYGPHWRNLRRITNSEVFSPYCVAASSAVRHQEVRSLSRRLYERCQSGGGRAVVDLKDTSFGLVLNIMSALAVGRRLSEEEDEGRRLRWIVKETFDVAGASNLGDFLPAVGWLDLLGLVKRLVRFHEKRDSFLQKLVDYRRRGGGGGAGAQVVAAVEEENSKKQPLIDSLLSLQQSDPDYYDDSIIKGLIMVCLRERFVETPF